jgi:hypothetical protein
VVSVPNELKYTLALWQTEILVACRYLGVVRRIVHALFAQPLMPI